MPKFYKIGEEIGEIPDEKSQEFLTQYPDAEEMVRYVVDQDTGFIPISKTEMFEKTYLKAKRLDQPQIPPELDSIGDPWKRGLNLLTRMPGTMVRWFENLMPEDVQKPYSTFEERPGAPEEYNKWVREAKEQRPLSEGTKEITQKLQVEAKPATGKYAKMPEGNVLQKLGTLFTDPKRLYSAVAENLPQMAAFLGSAIANPYLGFLTMTAAEGGDTVEAMDEYEKNTGQKIPEAYKKIVPTLVGTLNGALELTGAQSILKIAKIPGMKGKLLQYIIASQTEGVTETLQEVNQLVAQSGYEPIKPEDWDRLIESYYAGTVLALTTGVGGFAVKGEAQDAGNVRKDQGGPAEGGQVNAEGQAGGGGNIQRPAQARPGPGNEVVRPEAEQRPAEEKAVEQRPAQVVSPEKQAAIEQFKKTEKPEEVAAEKPAEAVEPTPEIKGIVTPEKIVSKKKPKPKKAEGEVNLRRYIRDRFGGLNEQDRKDFGIRAEKGFNMQVAGKEKATSLDVIASALIDERLLNAKDTQEGSRMLVDAMRENKKLKDVGFEPVTEEEIKNKENEYYYSEARNAGVIPADMEMDEFLELQKQTAKGAPFGMPFEPSAKYGKATEKTRALKSTEDAYQYGLYELEDPGALRKEIENLAEDLKGRDFSEPGIPEAVQQKALLTEALNAKDRKHYLYNDGKWEEYAESDIQRRIIERIQTQQGPTKAAEPGRPAQRQTALNFDTPTTKTYTTQGKEEVRYQTAKTEKQIEGNPALRSLKPDEVCYLERKYSKYKQLVFFGAKDKIESADDVAFAMRTLEDQTIEHAFVVHVRGKGKAVNQHISTGNFHSSIIDPAVMQDFVTRYGTTEMYFVHNHPSGTLKASFDDLKVMTSLKIAFPDIKIHGIIIDGIKNIYALLGAQDQIRNIPAGKGTVPLKALTFDRQVFKKDVDTPIFKEPADVAGYIAANRLGTGKKIQVIVCDSKLQITGRFNLSTANLDDIPAAAREIATYTARSGGRQAILVMNRSLRDESSAKLTALQKSVKQKGFDLTDIMGVEPNQAAESAVEAGMITAEPETKYEKEFAAEKAKQGVNVEKTKSIQKTLTEKEELLAKQAETEKKTGQANLFTEAEKKKQTDLFKEPMFRYGSGSSPAAAQAVASTRRPKTFREKLGGFVKEGFGTTKEQIIEWMGSKARGERVFNFMRRERSDLSVTYQAIKEDTRKRFRGISKKEKRKITEALLGIQGIDVKTGNPIFGAFQRAGVEPDDQIQNYKRGDILSDGRIVGDRIDVDGEQYVQTYRYIEPAAAQQAFDGLTPAGKKIALDYLDPLEQSKNIDLNLKLPAFSRDVLKTQFGINSDMAEELVSYVPSISPDPKIFPHLRRAIRTIVPVFSRKLSKHRLYQTGILREKGIEDKDFDTITKKVRGDLAREDIHNRMVGQVIATALQPLSKRHPLQPGNIAFNLGYFKDANSKNRILGIIENAGALFETHGIDVKDLKSSIHQAAGSNYQISEKLLDYLTTHFREKEPGILQAIDDVIGTGIRAVTGYWLIGPSTINRNIITNKLFYGIKTINDFWEGALKTVTFDKSVAPFANFTSDLFALVPTVVNPTKRFTPKQVISNERLGKSFLTEFEQEEPNWSLKKWFFHLWNATEFCDKRMIYWAEYRAQAIREFQRIKAGQPGQHNLPQQITDLAINGKEKEFIDAFIKNVPDAVESTAYDAMDRWIFDYNNIPDILRKIKRSSIGRGVLPYPTFFYKLWRQQIDLFNPMNIWEGLKAARTGDTNQFSNKLAKTLTAATVYFAIAGFLDELGDDDRIEGKNVPWYVDTFGRVKVSEDQNLWVRLYDIPYVGDMMAARAIYGGNKNLTDYFNDRISLGPLFEGVSILTGKGDKYDITYTGNMKPLGARVGAYGAGVMPYSRVLDYMKNVFDPVKRIDYDEYKNFLANVWLGFGSRIPLLSKTIPPKLSSTGKEIDVNWEQEFSKFWLLNVKSPDVEDYERALNFLLYQHKELLREGKKRGAKERRTGYDYDEEAIRQEDKNIKELVNKIKEQKNKLSKKSQ